MMIEDFKNKETIVDNEAEKTKKTKKTKKKDMINQDALMNFLYTVEELAVILKMNKNSVYALINKGLLPALKLGCTKVTRESLEEFLNAYTNKDLSDLDNIKDFKVPNEYVRQCNTL